MRHVYPVGSPHKGIDCADAWFDLVDTLCSEIQTHIDTAGLEQVRVKRIKAKLGTLRFVIFAQGDERIRGMINLAYAISARIPIADNGKDTPCPRHP